MWGDTFGVGWGFVLRYMWGKGLRVRGGGTWGVCEGIRVRGGWGTLGGVHGGLRGGMVGTWKEVVG